VNLFIDFTLKKVKIRTQILIHKNMGKSIILVLILLCFHFFSANNQNQDSTSRIKPAYSAGSSLFMFTVGYRLPVNANRIINSGHGLYAEGGFNPGYLISKDLTLGIYAGFGFMDRFWSTSFSDEFVKDFQSEIANKEGLSGLDSLIIHSSADLFQEKTGTSATMPGCEMNSFHNYSMYYGIVIKLPYKYSPVLKLYRGVTSTRYLGGGNSITANTDFNSVELKRVMHGCELMILSTIQKKNTKSSTASESSNRRIGLSIYYETCDFYDAGLYFYDGNISRSLPLKNFVSPSFLHKYKNEVTFGFKLSYCIL